MRKLLVLLLVCAIQCHAQVTLTTGPNIVVTLSNACTPVAAPSFSPAPNPPPAAQYGSIQSVTLTGPAGDPIYYTLDGSTPTAASTLYTGAITVASSLTINAIAVGAGCSSSTVGSGQYNINLSPTATPTFSPSPNTFSTPPVVTVSDLSAGATIYCTTDGSPPTTASPVYSGPFTFNTVGQTPLKCVAKTVAFLVSAVQSGIYIYQPPAATPVISPAAGTYTSSVSVTIAGTGGCTVYWAVNAVPTTASTVYSGAITVTTSETIQAMQTCTNYAQSAVAVSAYTITQPQAAATPTFSPAAGTYVGTQSVTLACATINPSMFYTTNGNPPTTASTPYTTAISVSATETIKAICTAPGFTTSAVGKALYTITGGGPILACPQSSTNGHLTINVTNPRTHGASPLFIFNDATGTTDSDLPANITISQGVTFTWTFGDSGASGTGVWLYGSNPNRNSMNSATGIVAGHLYRVVDGSGDITARATVTAQDADGNTVSCLAPVITVNDAAGVNGFGGVNTTCVSSSTTPVAGNGGCPAGAGVLKTASFNTALNATFMGNGKRVLFLCGDSFYRGANAQRGQIKRLWELMEAARGRRLIAPLLTGQVTIGTSLSDGRIADIDFEGAGAYTVYENGVNGSTSPGQLTLFNLNSTGRTAGYYIGWMHEYALVNSTMTSMGASVGNYLNYAGHQCANGSTAFNCGNGGSTWLQSNYINNNYQAIIGSSLNGASPGSGFETTEGSCLSAVRD